jgi:hypothetical protein
MMMSSKERREALQSYREVLGRKIIDLHEINRAKLPQPVRSALDAEIERAEGEMETVLDALNLAHTEEGDEYERAMAALRHFNLGGVTLTESSSSDTAAEY